MPPAYTAEFGRVKGLTIETGRCPFVVRARNGNNRYERDGPAQSRLHGSRRISDWSSGCRARARPDHRRTLVDADIEERRRAASACASRGNVTKFANRAALRVPPRTSRVTQNIHLAPILADRGVDQSSGFPNPEPETLLMAVATPRLVTLNMSANRPTVPPRPGNGNVLSARTSSPVDAGSRRLPRGSARTSCHEGDEEPALPGVTAVELVDAAQAQAAEPRERIRPEQLDRVREVQGTDRSR